MNFHLRQAEQIAVLVRKTRSDGGVQMFTIEMDVDAWSRLVTGGLAEKILQLPVS